MPTLAQALAEATHALAETGSLEARLEAEVLAMRWLGLTRAQLYSRWTESLAPDDAESLVGLVFRRRSGEPLAYITGRREFFGRDFLVDRRALIPRPETELLVEAALDWLRNRPEVPHHVPPEMPPRNTIGGRRGGGNPLPLAPSHRGREVALSRDGRGQGEGDSGSPRTPIHVADIGTGSGVIAISLALSCPALAIHALDRSADALALARENAGLHGVADRITFLEGDLLAPLAGPVDLLVANLPYVRQGQLPTWCGAAQVELAWEPLDALDGGPDGLETIRRFLLQAPGYLRSGGAAFLEIGYDQGEAAARLAQEAFPAGTIALRRDLAGLDRIVAVRLP
ncbi:MAG: peptide chain release factor N(5)-glutamine methyltransferase [Chloroflexi bacterium]|nr:peptide chain release factor N(5)-glutamine methyltransferase [Chloroflexota bacterium]